MTTKVVVYARTNRQPLTETPRWGRARGFPGAATRGGRTEPGVEPAPEGGGVDRGRPLSRGPPAGFDDLTGVAA